MRDSDDDLGPHDDQAWSELQDLTEYTNLVAFLTSHGFDAHAPTLDRIDVVVHADGLVFDAAILLTPYEWHQDMLGLLFSDFNDAAEYVKEQLRNLTPSARFLAYSDYTLNLTSLPFPSPNTLAEREQRIARGLRP